MVLRFVVSFNAVRHICLDVTLLLWLENMICCRTNKHGTSDNLRTVSRSSEWQPENLNQNMARYVCWTRSVITTQNTIQLLHLHRSIMKIIDIRKQKYKPIDMLVSCNNDSTEFSVELWTFLLTVLYHIISQIDVNQFLAWFSYDNKIKNNKIRIYQT